jgi:hypothetical protein
MKVCLLILVAVIALTVFLVYRVFDSAVTIDHLQMQAISNKQAAQEMLSLLNKVMTGRSAAEVQELMQSLVEPDLLKVRENEIEAGHLSFQFGNGRCLSVSLVE